MASFSTFRSKQIPALLMSEAQLVALNTISNTRPEGQVSIDHYTTSNFHHCPLAKASFETLFSKKLRNKDAAMKAMMHTDAYLGNLGYYRNLGKMDPFAYRMFLENVKMAHDTLQKIGELQNHQSYISKHIDEANKLHDNFVAKNSENNTNVDVKMEPSVDDEEFENKKQPRNALPLPPTNEGVDYHMSKAFYDPRARKWIQRKVDNTDPEKKKTYEKEFKKQVQAEQPDSVKESKGFSFKDFLAESELNTISRLQPDGEVKTRGEDEYYKKSKKSEPKFKEKMGKEQVQADPLSENILHHPDVQASIKAYQKHGDDIDHKFNEGGATCTHACKHVSEELSAKGISHKIHSGTYKDFDHYWVETKHHIIDNGDNISDSHQQNGYILPKVLRKDHPDAKNYVSDESLSPKEYENRYHEVRDW